MPSMIGDPQSFSSAREQFLQKLKDSGLSAANDIQQVLASLTETGETGAEALARQLVRSGELTAYQASAVLEGRIVDLRIGAYEVLDLLGKGAMGTVYKARHRTMKRLVAIKVLATEVANHGTFAQRFQREVETLAKLSHVNIIMAFDAGESPAGPFLVMEFIQGRDLATEVKAAGPLSLADAVDCARQAARGLEYAHDQGLIHRDIKPANLMRDVRGVVKVADLGLARIKNSQLAQDESALTRAGVVVGTVDYMAPEQAVDSSTVDHRVDIYSLGCTLFYLLTGRPLYSGSSLMSLLLQHRDTPPPALVEHRPDAPDFLSAIYLRMVAKKPSDRYASMTEVVLALDEASKAISALGLSAPAPRRAPTVSPSLSESTIELASARHLTDHGSKVKGRTATFVGDSPPSPSLVQSTAAPSPAVQGQPQPLAPEAEARAPVLPTAPQSLSHARRPIPWVFMAAAALVVLLFVGAALIWSQFPLGEPNDREPQTTQPKPPAPPAKPKPFVGVILNGGGSTFVNPLIQHWAGIYEKARGVRIDYQGVGSGRGIDGVLNRVFLFGCSDAPLTDKQLAKVKESGGNLVHVPLVLGAVVPAYNLPGIAQGQLRFTGPILADIYLGKITKWNDPALKIANPGINLPDMPITPVHRADKSGTTYIWTDYLSTVSGAWKTRFGAAMLMDWPGGLAGQGNNGVANLVSRTVGSIGYLELSYALENNLQFGQVKNREGKFITPTLESVTAAAGALKDIPADMRLSLIDSAGEDTYPIVGMTYALIHTNQTGNAAGREMVAFLRWSTHEGQAYVKELRYAPLPPELVQRIDIALSTVKLAPK
jgi:phosphate ABC transporter phosphate-binding protein